MKTSAKILLILIAVLSYAVAVIIILSRFLDVYHGLDMYLPPYLTDSALLCIVLTVVTLAVGTSLFAIVAESAGYRLTNRSDVIRISDDELGYSEISYEALRSIVAKKCRSFRFVTECSCDVDKTDAGTVLYIRIRPASDTILPSATAELRSEVVKTVKEQTSLDIKSVQVLILPNRTYKK